jgi:hypothetical protein
VAFGGRDVPGAFGEADAGTRTPDPLLTMEVLYQLSYVGANPKILPFSTPIAI